MPAPFSDPAAAPSDASPPPVPPIAPRSSLPTTLGVCNIVAAVMLMLGGLCCGGYSSFYLVMIGQMVTPMKVAAQQTQQQMQQAIQQQVDDLEKQIEQTEDEQKKTVLQQQHEDLAVPPPVNVPTEADAAAVSAAIASPALMSFIGVEVVSGLALNLLLLFTGVGLVSRRPWGRRWSMATCWMKIVRLLALYLLLMAVILPRWGKEITEAIVRLDPDPQTVAKVGQGITVFGSTFAVSVMLLGLIYPGVMLWLLNKPEIASECGCGPPR